MHEDGTIRKRKRIADKKRTTSEGQALKELIIIIIILIIINIIFVIIVIIIFIIRTVATKRSFPMVQINMEQNNSKRCEKSGRNACSREREAKSESLRRNLF